MEIIIGILVCSLNLLIGLLDRYEYDNWSTEFQTVVALTYSGIYLCITICIIYAFNSRLCKLLLSQSTSLDVDMEMIEDIQKQLIQIITRQTIIMSFILLIDIAQTLSMYLHFYGQIAMIGMIGEWFD